ncbi:DNA helicase [Tanacetum coccineum]
MRLNNKKLSEIEKHRTAMFAQWLLDVRNGEIGILDDSDPDNTSWVDTPDEYCIPNDDNGIIILINFIYDDDTLHHPFARKLQEKAIICPKNDTTDVINSKYLSLLMATTNYPDTAIASKGKLIAIEPKVSDIASLKPTYCNKIIELIVYRKWVSKCQQLSNTIPVLNIDNQRYQDLEQEKYQNRFPLATLLEVDPQNYQVIPGDPIPICKNHWPQLNLTYRTQANSLIKDCNDLLAKLPDRNPYQLPPALKELEGTTHIFQFHFDTNSTSRRKDFVLDTVFKKIALPLPAPLVEHVAPEPVPT